MIKLGRASTVAMLSLLAWAATASAECAWVLWERRVTSSKEASHTESWSALEVVETRAVCEAKTEALIQRRVQPSGQWVSAQLRANWR
jgi:hypothetical protein